MKKGPKIKIKDLYRRFAFLVPFIVGTPFCFIIYNRIWFNDRSSAITIILGIIVLMLIFSYGTWKSYLDPNFRNKIKEQQEKEKGNPWYNRGVFAIHMRVTLTKLVDLCLVIGVISFISFFYQIFVNGKIFIWLLVIGVTITPICYKFAKNIINNKNLFDK